ncbi:MAG: hypothetical protein AAF570_20995, partial [Bacteroidota bacterium]
DPFELIGELLEIVCGLAAFHVAQQFLQLANQFERVANVETKEWLPGYYQAYCLVTASFVDRGASAMDKDALLDRAESVIDKIFADNPAEVEVHVLKAYFLTARLSVDPATRGQQYSMLSQQAIGRALGINATHPRARYMKLSNDLGTARYFKSDTQKYCDQAQTLLDEWDDFKPQSEIHPSWGKMQVAGIIKSCK